MTRPLHWPRTPLVADLLALASAGLVVLAHVEAGIWDMGHPVWRPVGHGTVLIMYAWILAVIASARALLLRHGRSWAALVSLAVVVGSFLLTP